MTLQQGPSLAGIRWMMLACALGMMAVWPAIRLSQSFRDDESVGRSESQRPITPVHVAFMVLLDWIKLMAVLQVVIWPLRMGAGWSLRQMLVLDAALASWSLLCGAIIALGCMSARSVIRTACMIGCLAILLIEPVLMALLNVQTLVGQGRIWIMRVSPIQILWMCSDASANWVITPWIEPLAGASAAALTAWFMVLILARRRSAS